MEKKSVDGFKTFTPKAEDRNWVKKFSQNEKRQNKEQKA